METKFKVGDRITLIKQAIETQKRLRWFPEIEKLVGNTFVVQEIDNDGDLYIDECAYYLHPDWCVKVEDAAKNIPAFFTEDFIEWYNETMDLAEKFIENYKKLKINQ